MRWTIARILSLALLLFTGCVGIYNGVTEWGEGRTPAQVAVTVGVLLYGIFGLITAYGLLRRRRWSVKTAILWMIAVTYVPGLAVMADGESDAMLGAALAASGVTGLIALGVVLTAKATTRLEPRTASQT
jgi:hypothetical protein